MACRIDKQRLADDGRTVVEQVDFTWDGVTLCEQTTRGEGIPNPVSLIWNHSGLTPLAQTERIITVGADQDEIDSRFFGIITDLVGLPTQLVDEEGKVSWHTRSTLWGSTTWTRKSSAHMPLRFPGQYFDAESGLYYNLHRYYEPDVARYFSPDPLGLTAAPNPSAYVTNPHTVCDPLGLMPEGCKKVVYGESKGTGKDLKRSATVGDDNWQFNTGHAFDRPHTGPGGVQNDVRTTGLAADEIEQAIVNSVYDHVAGGGTIPRVGPGYTGPWNGEVKINGHSIGYRVSRTPDDVYRVATYWLNP
ncbi:RHS repeat-associated core domain-containing protein [Streptomyces sp. AF1A]|uniref:RHS repeat-associated core domain-containing protein n=1 Tax=Streptomyces sp. AF1A TaxID=3394350 RepID=UPI0039BC7C30